MILFTLLLDNKIDKIMIFIFYGIIFNFFMSKN